MLDKAGPEVLRADLPVRRLRGGRHGAPETLLNLRAELTLGSWYFQKKRKKRCAGRAPGQRSTGLKAHKESVTVRVPRAPRPGVQEARNSATSVSVPSLHLPEPD